MSKNRAYSLSSANFSVPLFVESGASPTAMEINVTDGTDEE